MQLRSEPVNGHGIRLSISRSMYPSPRPTREPRISLYKRGSEAGRAELSVVTPERATPGLLRPDSQPTPASALFHRRLRRQFLHLPQHLQRLLLAAPPDLPACRAAAPFPRCDSERLRPRVHHNLPGGSTRCRGAEIANERGAEQLTAARLIHRVGFFKTARTPRNRDLRNSVPVLAVRLRP